MREASGACILNPAAASSHGMYMGLLSTRSPCRLRSLALSQLSQLPVSTATVSRSADGTANSTLPGPANLGQPLPRGAQGGAYLNDSLPSSVMAEHKCRLTRDTAPARRWKNLSQLIHHIPLSRGSSAVPSPHRASSACADQGRTCRVLLALSFCSASIKPQLKMSICKYLYLLIRGRAVADGRTIRPTSKEEPP